MNYREMIVSLIDKIHDEKILRRVWLILDRAYNQGK
mgnify:CR=1 FL=1